MIKLKLVIIENKIARLNKFIDWLLYMVGYALILITASILFSLKIPNPPWSNLLFPAYQGVFLKSPLGILAFSTR